MNSLKRLPDFPSADPPQTELSEGLLHDIQWAIIAGILLLAKTNSFGVLLPRPFVAKNPFGKLP